MFDPARAWDVAKEGYPVYDEALLCSQMKRLPPLILEPPISSLSQP